MIATAGGSFDHSQRPVYFGAGTSTSYPEFALVAVNDCLDKSGVDLIDRLLSNGHKLLLDSGIFWLTNRHRRATGCSMDTALSLPPDEIQDFDMLLERYLFLTKTFGDDLWGYIELDQGGRDNKRRTRDMLHDEGLSPIPVYHPLNDGWEYFDEIASQYDRICYGNIVQAKAHARIRLLHTMWERRREYPHLWIHVLGLTVNDWCLSCPPDSCDSSTWLSGLRFTDVNTECAGLRRLGRMIPGFQYDQEQTRDAPRGRDAACSSYAQSVEDVNVVWRDMEEAYRAMGADIYPPRHEQEGTLAPS